MRWKSCCQATAKEEKRLAAAVHLSTATTLSPRRNDSRGRQGSFPTALVLQPNCRVSTGVYHHPPVFFSASVSASGL